MNRIISYFFFIFLYKSTAMEFDQNPTNCCFVKMHLGFLLELKGLFISSFFFWV